MPQQLTVLNNTSANPPAAAKTEVGSYFVSNYPPFSQWKPENTPHALTALNQAPRMDDPLGLYIHIPFCRKRCKFCYFKVYTDKNANEVETYINALIREMEVYSRLAALQGRKLRFAYFGGGTPSYLSERQLQRLVEGLNHHVSWDNAEEVTFECEPGTLKKSKLETLKSIGVTRLSLGVEHFDDAILEANGRAHLSPEIFRAYEWAREVGFAQVNIDLIAGMVGETEASWRETVQKAVDLAPDSVTIYQMELPYNTLIAKGMRENGGDSPVAVWEQKRRWLDFAFGQFEARGYRVKSATVAAKPDSRFTYTDALWHGGDMIGLGVASFSHFGGVNYQNAHNIAEYLYVSDTDELQLWRAAPLTGKQSLIREMILQLKTGRLDLPYFQGKFGVDIWREFQPVYEKLAAAALLEKTDGEIALTRIGLLRVDEFLPEFFETNWD